MYQDCKNTPIFYRTFIYNNLVTILINVYIPTISPLPYK